MQFSHVAQPAQAFLVATIAHGIDKTIWVLCPNVHSQELVYESLLNWHPNALFLPEAEFAAVENVLPDPEIAAERLALLMQVERERRSASDRRNAGKSRSSRAKARCAPIRTRSTSARGKRGDGTPYRTTRGRWL